LNLDFSNGSDDFFVLDSLELSCDVIFFDLSQPNKRDLDFQTFVGPAEVEANNIYVAISGLFNNDSFAQKYVNTFWMDCPSNNTTR
jgi:hypothetical protein